MNRFYIILFLFINFLNLRAQENYVQINGSTNVNKFKCTNPKLSFSSGVTTISETSLPNIILKVTDFDCEHKIMTKDFQKTLEADKFPNLTIKFLNFTKTQKQYTATVEVKMMNRSKRYNIEFGIINNKLIGTKVVKFSDFDIVPPKRMGGMIVVKDNLDLTFILPTKI